MDTKRDPWSVDDLLGPDNDIAEIAARPTDLQNSVFFAKRVAGKLHYHHGAKAWVYYDGVRWQIDAHGAAILLAKDCVREMQRLAAAVTDDQIRQKALKHALSSQSRKRLDAMIFLAQSDLPISPDQFDRDPYALNVQNGTIDLRTGILRPHSANDFISKLAPVAFDAAAKFPRWERFVREIMRDNHEMIDYMQRFLGLCLTGDVTEHLVAIFFGGGRNGKSTLIDALRMLLGDYAATIDASMLLQQRESSGPKPELVRLSGVRFASANELPEGGRLSENVVKALTGGDVISARGLHSNVIEIRPTWKLAVATNHRPTIRDNSDGMWRRVRLVEFGARFEGDACDPNLAAILAAERSGILNWALAGCRRWQKHRLGSPPTVAAATAAYRADTDLIGRFIESRCVLADQAEATGSRLYSEFTAWATESGERHVPTSRAFLGDLRTRGFHDKRSNGQTVFTGIGLQYAGANQC